MRDNSNFAHATAIMEKRAFMDTFTAASSGVAGVWKQYPLNVLEVLPFSDDRAFWTAYALPSFVTHVERFIGRS